MSIPLHGLGGRLQLLDPAKLEGAQRILYDRMGTSVVPLANAAGFRSKDDEGHFIGPFNLALLNPRMGSSFLALQKVEEEHTSLTARVRQVVILSVGSVWRAPYELYAHTAAAAKVGFSPAQIEALAEGKTADGLKKDELTAQRFTRQLAQDHTVDDATYESAQVIFGNIGLMEMVVLIGCYLAVCAQLNAFAIPCPTN
jgi:4-carboxymuconolactone decarboxylase